MSESNDTTHEQFPSSAEDEERPYSVILVTMQIRVLRGEITRSRISADIYPDSSLRRIARQILTPDDYLSGKDAFVVNFADSGLDLDDDYLLFDSKAAHPSDTERIDEINRYIRRSVNWLLDLHHEGMRRAQKKSQSVQKH